MSQRRAEAVDAVVIGNHFVNYYYSKLTADPSELHLFYQEQSSFSHGYENRGPTSLFAGPQNIKEKITSLNYLNSSVSISVIDVQPSHDGGILVLVMGFLSLKDQKPKKFAETFFLVAQEPTKYFVLNHIFRFIDEDSLEFLSQEAGAEETPETNIEQVIAAESNTEAEPKQHELPAEVPKPAPKVEAAPELLAPAATPAPAATAQEVPATPPPTPVTAPTTAPVANSTAESSAASNQKVSAPRGTKNEGAEGNETKPKGRGQGKREGRNEQANKSESNGGSNQGKTSAPNSWASIAAKTPAEGATQQESPVAAPKTTTPAPAQKPTAPKAAAPAHAASNGDGKSAKSNGPREHVPKSLYISNIPFSSTPEEINEIFAKFGPIKNIDIRAPKGFGFVEYTDPSHGHAVIESSKANPINVKGRVLAVEERRPMKGGNPQRSRPKVQGAAQ